MSRRQSPAPRDAASAGHDHDWRQHGDCAGLPAEEVDRLFFPAGEAAEETILHETRARYCAPCPVQQQCLDAGMAEKWGIWGGMTSAQRDTWTRRLRFARLAETLREEGTPDRPLTRRERIALDVRNGVDDEIVRQRYRTSQQVINQLRAKQLAEQRREREWQEAQA